MKKTLNLKNIGPKSEFMLKEIGIHSYDDLNAMGSVQAYIAMQEHYPGRLTLNALYAMEAALWGIHWLELPVEVKETLKAELSKAAKETSST
ncbi:TfoX/Sxy family protein [Paenibacillus sp. NPDC056579]|uniref:TfoX/Sxy family protein n=1 Tax=unclassified Paenibacillus TaxID=185978 RepID=UPI001EF7C8CA|nr:TfoX/Sxy family protein [Paenibacillus sp. H1-7]ULL13065.1 competence protein TfoX [Paenibacillus sp. H1-7]